MLFCEPYGRVYLCRVSALVCVFLYSIFKETLRRPRGTGFLRLSGNEGVATVRALKYHGGVEKADLGRENLAALEAGMPNLLQHVENITKVYGLPCVVAINRFPTDSEAELELVREKCAALGVNVALSEVWGKGGEGGIELANEVVRLCVFLVA